MRHLRLFKQGPAKACGAWWRFDVPRTRLKAHVCCRNVVPGQFQIHSTHAQVFLAGCCMWVSACVLAYTKRVIQTALSAVFSYTPLPLFALSASKSSEHKRSWKTGTKQGGAGLSAAAGFCAPCFRCASLSKKFFIDIFYLLSCLFIPMMLFVKKPIKHCKLFLCFLMGGVSLI